MKQLTKYSNMKKKYSNLKPNKIFKYETKIKYGTTDKIITRLVASWTAPTSGPSVSYMGHLTK